MSARELDLTTLDLHASTPVATRRRPGAQWNHPALDDAHPWIGLTTTRPPARPSPAYLLTKRALDIVVALCVLVLLAPVLALLALAVKVDDPRGPVLFCQERTGRGGRRFRMFKLRSMRPCTADDVWRDRHVPPGPKVVWDPRITPVGRFLRRTSLDEVPQLLNVLRGDMSIVGPRPTSLSAREYELWQTERLEVRPGLTGLWQIVARGAVNFPDRCRLDIAYARRPSLLLDLRIVARSVPAVLTGRGAR